MALGGCNAQDLTSRLSVTMHSLPKVTTSSGQVRIINSNAGCMTSSIECAMESS